MSTLIDLSHPLEDGQSNFPWDPKLDFRIKSGQ